jgi:hypothetical protein
MLETIKLVGAIVGLATGAFTVWDRWVRGRPLVGLTATVRTSRMPSDPCIRIANPGPTDLFIQRVRALPRIYGVAKDHSMRAKMAALESADVNVLLRSGQEHDLPIIDLRNEEDKNVSRWVHFVVYWRKTSSTWLPQAAVVIGTSTRAIEQIGAAVAAQWDHVP